MQLIDYQYVPQTCLCSSLVNATIPNSVVEIGALAFAGCSSLVSIAIPYGVTTIGALAFSRCSSLGNITIPKSVSEFEYGAFLECTSLEKIVIKAHVPPTIDMFIDYNYKSIPVYVPAESVDAYKAAVGWSEFTNIQAIPKLNYDLADDESYTIHDETDAESVTYNRNFNHSGWTSLLVPFAMSYSDWCENFEVAYINSIDQYDDDKDGTIDKMEMHVLSVVGGSIRPNTPYLIKPKSAGGKSIKVYDVTLMPAEEQNIVTCSTALSTFSFVGTYKGVNGSDLYNNNYYVMSNGRLCLTDGTAELRPYRWFMSVKNRNSPYSTAATRAANEIIVKVIGEDDGEEVFFYKDSDTQNKTFDLFGRRVDLHTQPHGLYIRNGKKNFVKQ